MAKQKKVDKIGIISLFMDFVTENGEHPSSVEKFCRSYTIKESDFKTHFSSFKSIEKEIFSLFFQNTLRALEQDDTYANFDTKNKVLSFYYTFFENLAANRAYVLRTLKNDKHSLQSLKKLTRLKKKYMAYIGDLDIERIDLGQDVIENLQIKTLQQSAWFQLLIILKFWIEDTSESFDKTDVFIEKSINTTFHLIDTKLLKSVIDLGKFMFKEKKHFKL